MRSSGGSHVDNLEAGGGREGVPSADSIIDYKNLLFVLSIFIQTLFSVYLAKIIFYKNKFRQILYF